MKNNNLIQEEINKAKQLMGYSVGLTLYEQATGTTTGGTCEPPSQLNATNITSNSATLMWGAVTNVNTYDVRVRTQGMSNWTTYNTPDTNRNLSNLSSVTTYEWEVRSICSTGPSMWSSDPNSTYVGQSGPNTFTTTMPGGGTTTGGPTPTTCDVSPTSQCATTWFGHRATKFTNYMANKECTGRYTFNSAYHQFNSAFGAVATQYCTPQVCQGPFQNTLYGAVANSQSWAEASAAINAFASATNMPGGDRAKMKRTWAKRNWAWCMKQSGCCT